MENKKLILYSKLLFIQILFFEFGILCPATLEFVFSFDLLWLFVISGGAKGIKLPPFFFYDLQIK